MKATKKNVIILMLVMVLIMSLSILVLQGTGAWNIYASADAGIVEEDNSFVVISDPDNIAAEFDFYQLNDTECSVTLRNMDATKAIIPSVGIINGKEYAVTEISGSGFSSAEKLIRVYIPESVKKIGSRAFYGCTSLELIYLHNVEEIEGSAFGNCTSLSQLIIPETVTYVGSYILRNSNTRVRVCGAENSNWSASWNNRNSSEYEVEYNSTIKDPNVLETIYKTNVRSATPVIEGYSVASGQPDYLDDNQHLVVPDKDKNIIIPATYTDEETGTTYDILAIDELAFEKVKFNNLIIEYSSETIYIGNNAFDSANGSKVIINRPVEFKNWYDLSQNSNQQFASSSLETIVLPSSVPCLTNSMFDSCGNLKNLYFIEISDKSSSVLLGEIEERIEEDKANEDTGKVYLSQNVNFTSIGDTAFQDTPNIIELHIYYSNIKTVGNNIVNHWDNENQEVIVHNETKIQFKNGIDGEGWHAQWFGNFTNYHYDKEIYTITFAPNGGELDVPDKKDVVFNKSVGKLPIPHKGIWVFDGWFINDEEQLLDDTIYKYKEDITLEAHWTERYQITLMHNNGTDEYDTVLAEYMEDMPEEDIDYNHLNKPNYDGYIFEGYFLDREDGSSIRQYYNADMTSKYYLDVEMDLVLVAHWHSDKLEYKLINDGKSYEVKVKNGATLKGHLIIPALYNGLPVTKVADYGFHDNYYENNYAKTNEITSITLPDTIEEIGGYGFRSCKGLTAVNFIGSSALKIIDTNAFTGCTALQSFCVPKNVESIGLLSFYSCTNMTEFTFAHDSKLNTICNNAFDSCYSLTSVDIPNSVTIIGEGVFEKCMALENVKFPNGITKIPKNMFAGCVKLNIGIPETITYIGAYAFETCAIKFIKIPATVTYIGESAFFNCKPDYIYVMPGNSAYSGEGNCLIRLSDHTLLFGSNNSVIPDNVKVINSSSFYHCDELNYIRIPGSVKEIGAGAFTNCTNLISVKIENDGEFLTIEDSAFYLTGIKSIDIPKRVYYIGMTAFYGCKSLTSVNFENVDGWRYSSPYTSDKTNISSDILKDSSTVAKYLTNNYAFYIWECDKNYKDK